MSTHRPVHLRFPRRPDRRAFTWPERRVHAPRQPPHAFAFARTGLRFGLPALGFRAGDVLLWPETIAEVVLHPLEEIGVGAAYYPVDDAMEPDWSALDGPSIDRARGIAMVHVFGQLQRVDRFQRLCAEHRLVLVEDATHAWGGTWQGQPVGSLGDLGIVAPHKSTPVANGAYLHVGAELAPEAFALPLQPTDANLSVMDESWRGSLSRYERLRWLWEREEPYSTQSIHDRVLPHWAMDAEYHEFLMGQDLAEHRARRRELYRVWEEWCAARGIRPTFPRLHPEASPWAFPGYVTSARRSRRWFRWGVRHGIEVFSWPTLPRPLAQRGSRALDRWRRLVAFPIHPGLDPDELRDVLARVASTP